MQSAPASRHFAVDGLVIQGGGLPAHATDQTDFFHAIYLCRLNTEVNLTPTPCWWRVQRLIMAVPLSEVSSSFAMEELKFTTAVPLSYAA